MSDQMITRDIANWMPKTFDETARSVRVAAVTENPVTVYDMPRGIQYSQITLVDGVYLPSNQQVPLLDSHNWRSVSNVLGSARNFKVNGNALECDVFFSGTPLGKEVAQKVREGHLTDFSVGFMPVETVWIPEGENSSIRGRAVNGPAQVITKWNLMELSITAIGKDRQAKVRIWDGEVSVSSAEPAQTIPVPDAAKPSDGTQWNPLSEPAAVQPGVISQNNSGSDKPIQQNEQTETGSQAAIPSEISVQQNQRIVNGSQAAISNEIPLQQNEQTGIDSQAAISSKIPVQQNPDVSAVSQADADQDIPEKEKREKIRNIFIFVIIILALLASAMIK